MCISLSVLVRNDSFDACCSMWMPKRCEVASASSESQSGETFRGECQSPSLALLLSVNSLFSSVLFVIQNWKKIQLELSVKALSLKFIVALSLLERALRTLFGKFALPLEGLCVVGVCAVSLCVWECLCVFVQFSTGQHLKDQEAFKVRVEPGKVTQPIHSDPQERKNYPSSMVLRDRHRQPGHQAQMSVDRARNVARSLFSQLCGVFLTEVISPIGVHASSHCVLCVCPFPCLPCVCVLV